MVDGSNDKTQIYLDFVERYKVETKWENDANQTLYVLISPDQSANTSAEPKNSFSAKSKELINQGYEKIRDNGLWAAFYRSGSPQVKIKYQGDEIVEAQLILLFSLPSADHPCQ